MEVLEITPQEFFSDIGLQMNKQSNLRESAIGNIETLFWENREIYEKYLASKDEQIAFLKSLLEKK